MQTLLTNSIICGDCKDRLEDIPSESVDLIYLDPPFFTSKKYEIVWDDGYEERSFEDGKWYKVVCGNPECGKEIPHGYKRCQKCGTTVEDAEKKRKDEIEYYTDWLATRLKQCHRVLKPTGSIYVHLDWHAVHYVKVAMDEIFGRERFVNEIIWQRTDAHNNTKRKYGAIHDTILFYTKTNKYIFNVMEDADELSEAGLKEYSLIQLVDGSIVKYKPELFGRRLKLDDATVPGVKNEDGKIRRQYTWRGAKPSPRRSWAVEKEVMEEMLADGRVYLRNRSRGAARCKVSYLDGRSGIAPQDLWYNVGRMKGGIRYPTEKPERLLERVIKTSSKPGELVLDPFCGCGTAIAVAQRLGRRWIGIDISPTSCKVMVERLQETGCNIGDADITGMPKSLDELEKMDAFKFEEMVVRRLHGSPTKPTDDRGIDGWLGFKTVPIQVKRSHKVGRPVVQSFLGAMMGAGREQGIIVAFDFTNEARDEVKNIKARHDIDIELKTAEELFQ